MLNYGIFIQCFFVKKLTIHNVNVRAIISCPNKNFSIKKPALIVAQAMQHILCLKY